MGKIRINIKAKDSTEWETIFVNSESADEAAFELIKDRYGLEKFEHESPGDFFYRVNNFVGVQILAHELLPHTNMAALNIRLGMED